MEFLSENTSLPDGVQVYPWMAVRAKEVKTNSLVLVNDGSPPTVTGLPATRILISKYRNTSTPHSSYLVCELPATETDVNHDIFYAPSAVTYESFSNNQSILANISNVNNTVAFEYRKPANTPTCMLSVSIDFNIWKASQYTASVPTATFSIKAFQAQQIDFSDEAPVGDFIGSDSFLLTFSVADAQILTNKQVCRFCILLQATGADDVPYYFRFKIARYQSTTDKTVIEFDQVTLNVTACDAI